MVQKFETESQFSYSEVEAIQFADDAEVLSEISSFVGKDISVDYENENYPVLHLPTPCGIENVAVGDYIVKLKDGNIWNSEKEIFEKEYKLKLK